MNVVSPSVCNNLKSNNNTQFLKILLKGGTKMKSKTKISGKQIYNFTETKEFQVVDTDGHLMSLRKAEGINKSSGQSAFMNDAKMTNISFDDLVMGNGPHEGYSTMEKDGDIGVSKWHGKIDTKIKDGIPTVTFEGTFSFVSGLGTFKNVVGGGGTYKGHFTSETSYEVDWEGEY